MKTLQIIIVRHKLEGLIKTETVMYFYSELQIVSDYLRDSPRFALTSNLLISVIAIFHDFFLFLI